VVGALDPRDPGVDVGLVLEEVHVPPGSFHRVVDGTTPLPALGAGPSATREEVHVKVHLSGFQIGFYACQSPGILKT